MVYFDSFGVTRHVSVAVERAKIATDLIIAMSGYNRHHLEFNSETNGSPKTRNIVKEGGDNDDGSVLSSETQGGQLVDISSRVNRSPRSFAEI